MSFIQKHATPLSVLAALLCAFAAPYMIPENPDSALFRSGVLGHLILLASVMPVRDALLRADRRTLIASAALGFLFACALSVGSELFIYDGLLRGFGSLLRRIAVPVMATPLFGGLCARLLLVNIDAKRRARRLPVWAYALVIFACWLPLLLAYWPGMLNYDFVGEYLQHIDGAYSNIHPLLHSALVNGVITLGETIHSRTFGLLMMSLIQMVLFALSLGYSCAFVQKRGAPWPVLLGMTALYALHPVFSVMSMSMTKDTLFAASALVLSLATWALIESPDAFLASKRKWALYAVACVGTALLRNNGVFALVFLFPGALIVLRGYRKQAARLFGASAGSAALVTLALTLILSPESLPSFQLYSIPAQQLVRAYNSDAMSEADKADIAAWYTSEEGLIVHPHLGDSAKGYLDRARIQMEGDQFLALWAKHAGQFAHEYLEAFLMLNVGSWYPDDLSHSTIYPDVSWNDKGYLQTQEYDMTQYDLHTTSYLPAVRDLYERICRRNDYQEYPIIAVLFSTATPLWALLLSCAALIAKRRTRLLPAALGVLGLWLSYLLGPCTLPRYVLPLFALSPALLVLALRSHPDIIHEKEHSPC